MERPRPNTRRLIYNPNRPGEAFELLQNGTPTSRVRRGVPRPPQPSVSDKQRERRERAFEYALLVSAVFSFALSALRRRVSSATTQSDDQGPNHVGAVDQPNLNHMDGFQHLPRGRPGAARYGSAARPSGSRRQQGTAINGGSRRRAYDQDRAHAHVLLLLCALFELLSCLWEQIQPILAKFLRMLWPVIAFTARLMLDFKSDQPALAPWLRMTIGVVDWFFGMGCWIVWYCLWRAMRLVLVVMIQLVIWLDRLVDRVLQLIAGLMLKCADRVWGLTGLNFRVGF